METEMKKNDIVTYGLPIVGVRLVRESTIFEDKRVTGPREAAELVKEYMQDLDREQTAVLNLNAKGGIINVSIISQGSLTESIITPRELFKSCILSNAAGFIFFHNHPSGDVTPSSDDFKTTERLRDAGKLLGIKMMDHIIVGALNGSYYSFADEDFEF